MPCVALETVQTENIFLPSFMLRYELRVALAPLVNPCLRQWLENMC